MYHIYPRNMTTSTIENMWLADAGQVAYYSIRGFYGYWGCDVGSMATRLYCGELDEQLPLEEFVYGHVRVKVLLTGSQVNDGFGNYSTCKYAYDRPDVNNYTCSCEKSLDCSFPWVGRIGAHGNQTTGGVQPFTYWHGTFVNKMGDLYWYNTPSEGNCDSDGAECTWQVLEQVKVTSSDCHRDLVQRAVIAKDPQCFDACDAEGEAEYGSCWDYCFFNVVLGNATLGTEGMTGEEITDMWLEGFAGVSEGGCPNLLESVDETALV